MTVETQKLTLPGFIAREGIRVRAWKSIAPLARQTWMRQAFTITIARDGVSDTLRVPRWGHGGGLGTPDRELCSIVSSLITDAQIHEQMGIDVAEYRSEFGPIDEDNLTKDRREITRILVACQVGTDRLRAWLGNDLYQELLYDVEGY